ncbi:pyridoxal phosphate-dependent aminotransferase [Streptomonospora alba]|uniref:pyridoxal phosphate-dependent aminotransferase n=1 Tax=Streptomonospora alba TaxID=183763 RepID=UPI000699B3AC|nr:pyridoxal phosphate-dependent aminotransferase [Streptomonospora alba]
MYDHLVLSSGLRSDGSPLPQGTRLLSAESLPMFAARPQHDDADAGADRVRALLREVREARRLTLRGTAVCGGAPGSLVNGLALLGGPDYGRTGRGDVLADRQVTVDLDGDPGCVARGFRHLERMARALGADDVRRPPEPDSAAASWSRAGTRSVAKPVTDLALGQIVLPRHSRLDEALGGPAEPAAHYCPPEGHSRLRGVLRDWLGARGVGPDREVTVTAGASMGLTAVLAALVPPGGAVLVPDPGYPPYRSVLRRLGLRAIPYPAPAAGERLNAGALARAPEARAIVWNSPANPTGWVADPEDLALLAAEARAHDLFVVSDEVYTDLAWQGSAETGGPCAAGIGDRTVVVDSVSKRHAAAGLRVGWVHGSAHLVSEVTAAHWTFAMSPPTHSQLAAAHLLAHSDAIVSAVRDQVRGALDRLPPQVPRPHAGPYLWLPAAPTGRAAAARIEKRLSVRTMPGELFGDRGGERVRANVGMLAAQGRGAERALLRALRSLEGERDDDVAEE